MNSKIWVLSMILFGFCEIYLLASVHKLFGLFLPACAVYTAGFVLFLGMRVIMGV